MTFPYCKRECTDVSNVSELPINLMVQATIEIMKGAPDSAESEPSNNCICVQCLENDKQSEVVHFSQECQIPLYKLDVIFQQLFQETKGYVLLPVDQIA